MDLDSSKTDEYFVTALHIFDYCGVDSAGTLRVDSMMDTFAPFVKTKKAEYKCLKSFLDPHKSNPAINVTELATALSRYSEEQKTKIDLDESFNLRSGLVPQDSDSGISTDGYQILEELQTELREKSHLAQQLRGQLEFTDRQHEEALAALTAERDSLRAHVNILREENLSLSHLRKDYDEACERLCASETALDETKREYESLRRRARVLHEQVSTLENDKLTLQEQLSRSKEECHRINDLYSSRQAALLEQHESLEAACAELSARARQHDRAMALVLSEKVLLETELKDLLNRSVVPAPPPPRSVDVSYTEEQMLTALDSLNADSRFSPEVFSVSTQADVPCVQCEKRTDSAPAATWRRYIWEPIKSLFTLFASLCLLSALMILYNVSNYHYAARRCIREAPAVPWRWLNVHDLFDYVFRIEYVGEVPM